MVAMTFKQDSMSESLPVSTNLRPCVLWKAPPDPAAKLAWSGDTPLSGEAMSLHCWPKGELCLLDTALQSPPAPTPPSESPWPFWMGKRNLPLGAVGRTGTSGRTYGCLSRGISNWRTSWELLWQQVQGLCLEFHLWENSSTPEAAAHGSNTKVHLFLSWRRACTTPSQATSVFALLCIRRMQTSM